MPSLFPFPDLSSRCRASEWMDDFSVAENNLQEALEDIRHINRLLGGYRATDALLDPVLRRQSSFRLLDVGTGSGDYLVHLLRRGRRRHCRVEATGIDANPVTVGYGRAYLDDELPPPLRNRARVDIADALHLPYPDDAFDVTHAALFLHHFENTEAVRLLREMHRVSRLGIVVNDLHRHLLAYVGIWIMSRALRLAPMVQYDGPMSVRRGFHRSDLISLAQAADLPAPHIQWHWAFRWTLSTISSGE